MNAQGDVIALLDENYNIVVKYTYDTWGKVPSSDKCKRNIDNRYYTYAGTGATYLVNEICSYIPRDAEFNGGETRKEITKENVFESLNVLHGEAIFEGTKSFGLGMLAGEISGTINFNLPEKLNGASRGTLGLFGAKMTLESGIETTCNIQEERLI